MPKASYKPKQILTKEQVDTFLAADRNKIWRDFFYTELTTGLRRGEICGLMWQDFDEKDGTLKVLRSVNVPKAGELEIGETKTSQGRRTIHLPPSTSSGYGNGRNMPSASGASQNLWLRRSQCAQAPPTTG